MQACQATGGHLLQISQIDVMNDGNFLLGMRVHYANSNFKTIAIGSNFNQRMHKMESAKFARNEFIT